MNILGQLWSDEQGSVLSAEVATVATIAVLGATAGLSTVTTAINGELLESAHAFRSLNQSYSVRGFASCRAYTAGSCYTQPAVAKSLEALTIQSDVVPGAIVKPGVKSDDPTLQKKEQIKKRRMKSKKNKEAEDVEADETVSPAEEKNAEDKNTEAPSNS